MCQKLNMIWYWGILSPVFRFSDTVSKIVSNTKDEMPFSYLRIDIGVVILYHKL